MNPPKQHAATRNLAKHTPSFVNIPMSISADPQNESPIPVSEIDHLLTAQIVIAWAGEGGEEKRMGWWRSDLISEFGGEDLFKRMLPNTWQWSLLQAVREVARQHDKKLRGNDHDADSIVSLYRLGFLIDERLDDRLAELKRLGGDPKIALPGLKDGMPDQWDKASFEGWMQGHGKVESVAAPLGRRIRGTQPESLDLLTKHLIAACSPLTDEFPMPHFRSKE